MRFPLVRRSAMEAALEAQRGLYNGLMGEKEHLIVQLHEEHRRLARVYAETDNCRIDAGATIVRLQDELARLREHFDATVRAKDAVYAILHDSREALLASLDVLESENASLACELSGLGIATPFDWASPLPCWDTIVIEADIHGITGGPAPCPTCPPSPTG